MEQIMFDYIKEEIRRVRGIDAAPVSKKRDGQKGKKGKPLYSASFKVVTYIIFSLYLIVSVSNIFFLSIHTSFLSLFINIFLTLLAAAICVFLILSRKTFEILALTGTLLFVVILYLSMII